MNRPPEPRIRAFVAIELPDPLRSVLAAAQQQLQAAQPRVKIAWARTTNLHLTLLFLGDIELARAPILAAALDEVAARHAAFAVAVSGAGAFPDQRRPRVLWAGCADSAGRLRRLADDVRVALGFPPEPRPFTAHLTLGRIKFPRPDAALTRALDSLKTTAFGALPVAAIHLFQSQLHPAGSIYTSLSSHNLKES